MAHNHTNNLNFLIKPLYGIIILLCVLVLSGCQEQETAPVWENYPLNAQIPNAERSLSVSPQERITEEKTGYMFIDNRNDVFEDGVVTVNNSSYQIPDSLMQPLLDTMAEYNFITGFYVIDLETHMSFGLNVDKKFSAASTIKTPYSLYLAKEIAAGRVDLSTTLEYQEHHYCTGSGSTQYSEYGTLFTIKALFYRMLYNSDNIAYYMLSEYTGVDGVNELLASVGCDEHLTWLNHWISYTPRNLATIWMEIYDFKDTCDAGQLLWKYLTTNLYNEFYVAMPEYEAKGTTAHKSGWNTTGYHESGIVDGNRQYICVVMTDTGNKNNCLHRTIRNLDNIMNDYDIWLKNQ